MLISFQYDMLTSPITTPHFRTSVLNLVATYHKTASTHPSPEDLPVPLIPALKPIDSTLMPSDTISQLLITASTWIDLASPDPVIANVSRQVFNLEVAYAAFCGVQHIVVQGPTVGNGAVIQQFSRAMQEAIAVGPYIQFHLQMPLGDSKTNVAVDAESLAAFARADRNGEKGTITEWSSWEVWHAVRQFCHYSGKLTLGRSNSRPSKQCDQCLL
jgi:protein arginine N-methyltransferase 5